MGAVYAKTLEEAESWTISLRSFPQRCGCALLSFCLCDPLLLLERKTSVKVSALDFISDGILFTVHCLKEQRQTHIHSWTPLNPPGCSALALRGRGQGGCSSDNKLSVTSERVAASHGGKHFCWEIVQQKEPNRNIMTVWITKLASTGRGRFCPSDVCKRLKMNSHFSCLWSPALQTLGEVIPFDVVFKPSHLEKV